MKKTMGTVVAGLLLGVLFPVLAVAEQQTPADQKIPPDPKAVMLPAGSILHVRLTSTLTSKTNKSGDRFTGEVTQPIAVNGQEVIPVASTIEGHVTYAKSSGRIRGKAELRIVLDKIETPENLTYPLSAGLADLNAGDCAKMGSDNEGTIEGCGKSVKTAAKQAAIGAGIGAAGGLSVGLSSRGGCSYYGCWPSSGPGVGTDVMYGAGVGAGTMLIYNLLKHEKQIILVQGTELTFLVNRSVGGGESPPTGDSAGAKPAASQGETRP